MAGQFSAEELNLLLHAVDHYARSGNTREGHRAPAWALRDKLCNLGADYTGPTPEPTPKEPSYRGRTARFCEPYPPLRPVDGDSG